MSCAHTRSDDAMTSGPGAQRRRTLARRWGLVVASSVIVVVSSEKFYWYPQGFPGLDNIELVAVYAIGVLAFLMTVRRFGLDDLPSVVLASAVFSLVVEGAVTPVMYEDGPLPLLALYFLGWHGLSSVVVGWYAIRRLALDRRPAALTAVAASWGFVVGLWSTVYWSSSRVEEMRSDPATSWDYGQWTVTKFGLYMVLMAAILVVAHWMLGRLWVDDWTIGRTAGRVVVGLVVVGVGLWTPAVPYAPLKFAVCAWVVYRLVIGSSGTGRAGRGEPTLFETLGGRLRFRDLAPVGALVPGALAPYFALTLVAPSSAVVDALYWVLVSATVIAGTVAVGWAYRVRTTQVR